MKQLDTTWLRTAEGCMIFQSMYSITVDNSRAGTHTALPVFETFAYSEAEALGLMTLSDWPDKHYPVRSIVLSVDGWESDRIQTGITLSIGRDLELSDYDPKRAERLLSGAENPTKQDKQEQERILEKISLNQLSTYANGLLAEYRAKYVNQ